MRATGGGATHLAGRVTCPLAAAIAGGLPGRVGARQRSPRPPAAGPLPAWPPPRLSPCARFAYHVGVAGGVRPAVPRRMRHGRGRGMGVCVGSRRLARRQGRGASLRRPSRHTLCVDAGGGGAQVARVGRGGGDGARRVDGRRGDLAARPARVDLQRRPDTVRGLLRLAAPRARRRVRHPVQLLDGAGRRDPAAGRLLPGEPLLAARRVVRPARRDEAADAAVAAEALRGRGHLLLVPVAALEALGLAGSRRPTRWLRGWCCTARA